MARQPITEAEKEKLEKLIREIFKGRVWSSVNDPWYAECFGIIQALDDIGLWKIEESREWLDNICKDYRTQQ